MTDLDIIPLATTILRDLANKPREQIQFTPAAIPILRILEEKHMVSCQEMSNLPEQNIWSVEYLGLKWLEKHGLLP